MGDAICVHINSIPKSNPRDRAQTKNGSQNIQHGLKERCSEEEYKYKHDEVGGIQ